ncbi:MAG: hypothetical protein WD511_00140 [Balneolaceae bacterium]
MTKFVISMDINKPRLLGLTDRLIGYFWPMEADRGPMVGNEAFRYTGEAV